VAGFGRLSGPTAGEATVERVAKPAAQNAGFRCLLGSIFVFTGSPYQYPLSYALIGSLDGWVLRKPQEAESCAFPHLLSEPAAGPGEVLVRQNLECRK
jgi:hypothetical protein